VASIKRIRIIKNSQGIKRCLAFYLTQESRQHATSGIVGPGYYFVEWWAGHKRRRQAARADSERSSRSPAGENGMNLWASRSWMARQPQAALAETPLTLLSDAIEMFLAACCELHSPTSHAPVRRYGTVLEHASRILGRKTIDAIKRPEIDDYKKCPQSRGEANSTRIGR